MVVVVYIRNIRPFVTAVGRDAEIAVNLASGFWGPRILFELDFNPDIPFFSRSFHQVRVVFLLYFNYSSMS